MTAERAEQILEIINWRSYGCLLNPGGKPAHPPITSEEDKQIREYWLTLPGNYSYYSTVIRMKHDAMGIDS